MHVEKAQRKIERRQSVMAICPKRMEHSTRSPTDSPPQQNQLAHIEKHLRIHILMHVEKENQLEAKNVMAICPKRMEHSTHSPHDSLS